MVADGSANNSYIDFANGSRLGLEVPSGSETGLKLVSGFTVPSSGVVDYTIDFDLRKAITCPPGQAPACILKPVERLVNNTSVGNIQGQITSTLPTGCTPGVYLYSGAITKPEDMNSNAAADPAQPLGSKVPVPTSMPPYYYQFTFLPPGTYTVAFTCQAALDNPDQPDTSVVTLTTVGTAAVTAGQTATVDITLGGIQGQITSTLPTGCTPGVYLYSGNVTAPEDWNSMAPSADVNQPLASTLPVATSAPPYLFQFTALSPGSYTLALTCQATAGQSDPGRLRRRVQPGHYRHRGHRRPYNARQHFLAGPGKRRAASSNVIRREKPGPPGLLAGSSDAAEMAKRPSSAVVVERTRGRPRDAGNGAQIFVDCPYFVLCHVPVLGPRHDL